MRHAEVLANIVTLNERFRIPEIDELVARKRDGAEKMRLEQRELAAHAALLDRLERELEQAHETSQLPDEATTVTALDDFVVRLRLSAARAR
jgi:hypothetical protein